MRLLINIQFTVYNVNLLSVVPVLDDVATVSVKRQQPVYSLLFNQEFEEVYEGMLYISYNCARK